MNTILLVEDSVTDTEAIYQHLRYVDVAVVNVKSVEEAQTKLQIQQPDLVVLDVILPGQSGFELCRKLKNDPKTKQIPIVMCSTKGTEADKLWGSMLGADAYLTKPIDGQELAQTIQKLLRSETQR
jgi:DNA-binding response OmpR family regulator